MAKKAKILEVDRIANFEKFSDRYTANTLKGMYSVGMGLNSKKMEVMLKDKEITYAEKGVLVSVLDQSLIKSKTRHLSLVYAHDRTFGKVADVVQHIGMKDAAPIQMNVQAQFDEAIKTADSKTLRELQKSVAEINKKLGK